ncbi:hypothetical protein PENTCL1PPCAC_30677, partial [Pristionchus entomophagus]
PQMECLICSESIVHARMGVNACRACAAFYKRTSGNFKRLKCKGGGDRCREKNPKTTCRKCRLARFKEVLSRAGESPVVIETKPMEIEETASATPATSSTFIDHKNFYDCEPTTSETPLLNRIRRGYSLMCLIRKSGELALKPDSREEGEISVDNLVLSRAKYSTTMPNVRVAKNAFIEFASFAFDDFRLLDEKKKNTMIETSFSTINILETTYRARHHFPEDDAIRTPGYTTYLRNTDLETFFDDCPDKVDKKNLIREFKNYFVQSSKIVRQHFDNAKPTDIEFLALFGLALWSDAVTKDDETLSKIATPIRSEIMKELHIYYAWSGTADYASRVGNIFCLLVNCQNHSVKTHEDFQVFRLLNLFD